MAKKREASKCVNQFMDMRQRRLDCLDKYGIIAKPQISVEEIKHFLELQDYRTVARFIIKEDVEDIFLNLKDTNPLFKNIKTWDDFDGISKLIDVEIKRVFEPGDYTYL
jgi:glutaredoxin-related protein